VVPHNVLFFIANGKTVDQPFSVTYRLHANLSCASAALLATDGWSAPFFPSQF
jgi:hypothetical protein